MNFFLLALLCLDPGFELPDGFALHRQLDVGVEGIDFVTRGVAHQGFPDVLQNTRLHEARVEGVAKIVKTEVATARSANGRLPGRFDPVDLKALEGENQAFRLFERREECREPRSERDLAGLSARGL